MLERPADVLTASRCCWRAVSEGAASQALPCQETLGEGADLKQKQMVSAVFSL